MSIWSGLRALFGAPKPKKVTARPTKKPALPPAERAALLKEALMAHRAGRAHIREVLERQLNELRAKVPKPGRGAEASESALSLHQSDPALKRLMTHDLKRFLALIGIRRLLDEQSDVSTRRRAARKG